MPQSWHTPFPIRDIEVLPAIADGVLYTTATGGEPVQSFLYALRASDGVLLWKTPVQQNNDRTLVADGRVFTAGEIAQANDAATGRLLWTYTPPKSFEVVEGDVGGGRLFLGSRQDGTVRALNPATGALLWERPLHTSEWFTHANVRALRLHEGALYVLANRHYDANNFGTATVVAALDPSTGADLWRYQDGDGTAPHLTSSSITFYQNLVLYGDVYVGFVAAFDRTTRQRVWYWKTPPGFSGAWDPPTVEGDRAYVALGDGNAYALNAATGARLWTGVGESSFSSQAVCGNYVVGASTFALAFEKATGKNVRVILGDGPLVKSRPFSDGSTLYVGAEDGMYAFDCTR